MEQKIHNFLQDAQHVILLLLNAFVLVQHSVLIVL